MTTMTVKGAQQALATCRGLVKVARRVLSIFPASRQVASRREYCWCAYSSRREEVLTGSWRSQNFVSDLASRYDEHPLTGGDTTGPSVRKAIGVGIVLLTLTASSCGYAARTAVRDRAQATPAAVAVPAPT